jgi:hypothetical protein
MLRPRRERRCHDPVTGVAAEPQALRVAWSTAEARKSRIEPFLDTGAIADPVGNSHHVSALSRSSNLCRTPRSPRSSGPGLAPRWPFAADRVIEPRVPGIGHGAHPLRWAIILASCVEAQSACVRPRRGISGGQFGDPALIAAEPLIIEQLTPLAVIAAMKEVLITAPDAVAHLGNQFIGPLLHALERGGRSNLLDPFARSPRSTAHRRGGKAGRADQPAGRCNGTGTPADSDGVPRRFPRDAARLSGPGQRSFQVGIHPQPNRSSGSSGSDGGAPSSSRSPSPTARRCGHERVNAKGCEYQQPRLAIGTPPHAEPPSHTTGPSSLLRCNFFLSCYLRPALSGHRRSHVEGVQGGLPPGWSTAPARHQSRLDHRHGPGAAPARPGKHTQRPWRHAATAPGTPKSAPSG